MRTTRLYVDTPLSVNQSIDLPEGPTHHLSKVLRARQGQAVELFNGDGLNYTGTISSITKKQVTVDISASSAGPAPSPIRLHVGQVISKGDRMDYMVQKATELGVTEITPLFSERCDVKLNAERQDKRLQHWQQIAIHACEQSGRAEVPAIHPATPLTQWVEGRDEDRRFVLHYANPHRLGDTAAPQSIAVLVGPEGGFSDAELSLAHAHHFQTLALGPRILRTETAPLAALSVLQWHWGDFSQSRS